MRKSPKHHRVKQHARKNKSVRSYERGRGSQKPNIIKRKITSIPKVSTEFLKDEFGLRKMHDTTFGRYMPDSDADYNAYAVKVEFKGAKVEISGVPFDKTVTRHEDSSSDIKLEMKHTRKGYKNFSTSIVGILRKKGFKVTVEPMTKMYTHFVDIEW